MWVVLISCVWPSIYIYDVVNNTSIKFVKVNWNMNEYFGFSLWYFTNNSTLLICFTKNDGSVSIYIYDGWVNLRDMDGTKRYQ